MSVPCIPVHSFNDFDDPSVAILDGPNTPGLCISQVLLVASQKIGDTILHGLIMLIAEAFPDEEGQFLSVQTRPPFLWGYLRR